MRHSRVVNETWNNGTDNVWIVDVVQTYAVFGRFLDLPNPLMQDVINRYRCWIASMIEK